MDRKLPPLVLLMTLSLTACDPVTAPAGAAPEGVTAVAAVDRAEPGNPASDLPEEFIVSTNEPFWQARVEGDGIVLSGPGVDGRRFAIQSRGEGDGARQVHASDATGAISVTLLPGPCQDSMSGATFPHAGELTIDGIGPTPGCARPADMPPPGEPGL